MVKARERKFRKISRGSDSHENIERFLLIEENQFGKMDKTEK